MPHHSVPRANQRFARRMRQALTPAELRLWLRLRSRVLESLRFRRQAPMGPYILDFFCSERKLAVEVDGDQHGFRSGEIADARRDEWLARHGIRVLRFTNREVQTNIEGVCDAIVGEARSRAPNPPLVGGSSPRSGFGEG